MFYPNIAVVISCLLYIVNSDFPVVVHPFITIKTLKHLLIQIRYYVPFSSEFLFSDEIKRFTSVRS